MKFPIPAEVRWCSGPVDPFTRRFPVKAFHSSCWKSGKRNSIPIPGWIGARAFLYGVPRSFGRSRVPIRCLDIPVPSAIFERFRRFFESSGALSRCHCRINKRSHRDFPASHGDEFRVSFPDGGTSAHWSEDLDRKSTRLNSSHT